MRSRLLLRCLAVAGVLTGGSIMLQLFPARAAGPGMTERVSVDSTGVQGNSSSQESSVSANGRYVAFASAASNLVPGDTNGAPDVFVRDRETDVTERLSVDSAGAQANDLSAEPSISADGRYVAFYSWASNLVSGDTNVTADVFGRDRETDVAERVSVDSADAQGNGGSAQPSISADGRYVAFLSTASNLVSGDTNADFDVFLRDRLARTTERVSVDSAGAQANGSSIEPSISADGRYVTFHSWATNLVSGDTNGVIDVFVRDLDTDTTERVSVDSVGVQGNDQSGWPSISTDGRYVAFLSGASNLVPGDTNGFGDVFVRDLDTDTTERVSVASAGVQGNNGSDWPSISADGRFVAFQSMASNLVPGDTNAEPDVFVRERLTGATERVSVTSAGAQGNAESTEPSISADGRYVAFYSWASNLVDGDTNGFEDVFVRDRVAWVAVGGIAEPPDATALPSDATPSGRGYTVYIIGAAAALVVALGAAGWRKRRA